jgi:hypothetical protein
VLRGYYLTKNRNYPPPPLTFINRECSLSGTPFRGLGGEKEVILAANIFLTFKHFTNGDKDKIKKWRNHRKRKSFFFGESKKDSMIQRFKDSKIQRFKKPR